MDVRLDVTLAQGARLEDAGAGRISRTLPDGPWLLDSRFSVQRTVEILIRKEYLAEAAPEGRTQRAELTDAGRAVLEEMANRG